LAQGSQSIIWCYHTSWLIAKHSCTIRRMFLMMHLRSLVLLALLLPGVGRRSFRVDGSRRSAQQRNDALAGAMAVSAEARESFLPTGLGKVPVLRPGPTRPPRLPALPADRTLTLFSATRTCGVLHRALVRGGMPVQTIAAAPHSPSIASEKLAYYSLRVLELRERLRARGLKVSGNKSTLVERLVSDVGLQTATAVRPAPLPPPRAPTATSELAAFRDLPISNTLKAAIDDMGLQTTTPVQAATLRPLLEGVDVVAKARTGTGKTVAFLVPTLQRLIENRPTKKGQIRALVLSPTRELAAQIAEAATGLMAGSKLRTACILGGTAKGQDRKELSGDVDLLVATPGRLWDHMQNEGMTSRLQSLQTLILDEGDRLLDAGFSKQIAQIVQCLPRARQSLCFSATMPKELQSILGHTLRSDHIVIDCVGAAADGETSSNVRQSYISSDMNDLPALAAAIVRCELDGGNGKVIVFCPTANHAEFLSELMRKMGVPNKPLHSRKSQAFRSKVSTQFRNAKSGVLVASDVAARGVDYPDVSLVVQVGAPESREQYVHRTGRTGRAGKTGRAVLLLSDWEERATIKGMLDGLPISKDVATDIDLEASIAQAAQAVSCIEESTRQKAYAAWLGYYKQKMKPLRWDAATLVKKANSLALGALGLNCIPELPFKTVCAMGLRGTSGVNVLKGPRPRQGHYNSNHPYSGGRGLGGAGSIGGGRGGGSGGGGGPGRGRGRGAHGMSTAAGAISGTAS